MADDEIETLNRIAAELDRMDAEAQRRTLIWAWAKYVTDRPSVGPVAAAAEPREIAAELRATLPVSRPEDHQR